MGRKQNRRRTLLDVLAVMKKYEISSTANVHNIRMALEELGPTFVKMGQLIATQSDLFPPELVDELRGLRDEVAPMTPEEVDQVLFEVYGKKKEEVFEYFDEEAHGSASISQVHHARLHTGEDVAVKIQRIGAAENMEKDLNFMKTLVRKIPFLRKNPYIELEGMVDELARVTHQELDFMHEAANLQRFHELNEGVAYTTCPAVYPEYTTSRVLVMEYIKGIHPTDRDALIREGYDPKEIAKKYVHSFLKQVFEDGFFQADPHAGNIRISGGRIVWYDLGMMGEMAERDRISAMDTAESLVTGDVAKCYDGFVRMCRFSHKYDKEELYKDVSDFAESVSAAGLENIDVNLELRKLMRIAKVHGAHMDPAHTMMSRGIATVQGTVTEICPEVDFYSEIKDYAIRLRLSEITKKKDRDIERLKKYMMLKKLKAMPENIANTIEEYSKGLAPVKMEMGIAERSQPFVKDIVRMLVDGFVTVALLVSSSIIILSGVRPLVHGIPLLGLIGYLLAGLRVAISIIKQLWKNRRNRRRR
ncbi:MAG: AarF/ABC1/UbiB kinase family protein [Mogibacterium sp.]|nr:AarF/ABC1/UbiB kinase family protein [Mogibacterium sp.]